MTVNKEKLLEYLAGLLKDAGEREKEAETISIADYYLSKQITIIHIENCVKTGSLDEKKGKDNDCSLCRGDREIYNPVEDNHSICDKCQGSGLARENTSR